MTAGHVILIKDVRLAAMFFSGLEFTKVFEEIL
jgi:hypothetical protein